ncbi:MAG: efflux RND transporter periplasmic adaptor subunit [Oscillospiraceae bacterium]|nr:efflux RND transporter periplasmic adaptor subunit [Oscillospiraceae bacterium]
MKKKKIKIGCIIAITAAVLVLGAVIYVLVNLEKMVTPPLDITYGEAKVEDLSEYVNISGIISSSNTFSVTSELEQKITKIYVNVGDSVKKGDVLCELDAESLQETYRKMAKAAQTENDAQDYKMNILNRNLTEARNERSDLLASAQNALNKATAARNQAYQNYNDNVQRMNQIVEEIHNLEQTADMDAAIAEQMNSMAETANAMYEMNEEMLAALPSYDEAEEAAREAYKEALKRANELVQGAQDAIDAEAFQNVDDDMETQLKKIQEQIDSCVITAPADGVITQLNITEGSYPMSANLMVIEDTDSLIVKGQVSESVILSLEEGMRCEINATAIQDQEITGSVKRIEKIVSSNSEVALSGYTVEVSIDKKDSNLLIGMSASAKIILDEKKQVLSVPYDAILGGETGGYFVYVLESADPGKVRLVKKNVEVGFIGDYYTEIIGSEVKAGDYVVTVSDQIALEDGMIVDDPRNMNAVEGEQSDAS